VKTPGTLWYRTQRFDFLFLRFSARHLPFTLRPFNARSTLKRTLAASESV
jgi:hypothetical protein